MLSPYVMTVRCTRLNAISVTPTKAAQRSPATIAAHTVQSLVLVWIQRTRREGVQKRIVRKVDDGMSIWVSEAHPWKR
jgi:hypothetical protein